MKKNRIDYVMELEEIINERVRAAEEGKSPKHNMIKLLEAHILRALLLYRLAIITGIICVMHYFKFDAYNTTSNMYHFIIAGVLSVTSGALYLTHDFIFRADEYARRKRKLVLEKKEMERKKIG